MLALTYYHYLGHTPLRGGHRISIHRGPPLSSKVLGNLDSRWLARRPMSCGYVVINVEPGSEASVCEAAASLDCVTDSNLLFGDYDLIGKVEGDDMGDIARNVVESIRSIPGVVNTKTLACAEM